MAEPSAPSARKRGVKLLLLAILLLVVLVVVLAFTRPDLGTYPLPVRALAHALWVAAITCFGSGSFHAFVGAPGEGIFRGMRTPVRLLVGGGSLVALAVGAFILQISLTHERTTSDADADLDFDWD